MPDQPRPDRPRRPVVLLLLGLFGAFALAAVLAGDAFGSAPPRGAAGESAVEGSGAVHPVVAARPNQSGPLAVQYTSPAQNDVGVDSQATVLVQFNHPVEPITALTQRSTRTVLSFDPPVNGAGHWLTSSLYVFRPDGLQPNAHYTVHVLQQLSDQPDGQLPQEYVFGFD